MRVGYRNRCVAIAQSRFDAKQFKKALKYACALIHLGKAWDDNEGYLTGLTAYIHIASATDNYELAIKAYIELLDKDDRRLNKKREESEAFKIFEKRQLEQKNGELPMPEFQMPEIDAVDLYSKPTSYSYLSSKLMAAHEMALRNTAKEMGIGKKTVLSIMSRA